MIRKTATEDPDLVTVRFSLPVEIHSEVYLVGDFNDWDGVGVPLTVNGDGQLTATVQLKAGGRYAFRYRTGDGRWFNDEGADDYEDNEFGGSNGVVLT
jgi:1,4-alpha-glucan branching enzyme